MTDLTARVREPREMCTWRWARLVWGPRWRRSRCLSGTKGNEGEHVCAPSRIENRESQASPPRWGRFRLLRESHAASYARSRTPSSSCRQDISTTRAFRSIGQSIDERRRVSRRRWVVRRSPTIQYRLSARLFQSKRSSGARGKKGGEGRELVGKLKRSGLFTFGGVKVSGQDA